jgi:hypothetical protein
VDDSVPEVNEVVEGSAETEVDAVETSGVDDGYTDDYAVEGGEEASALDDIVIPEEIPDYEEFVYGKKEEPKKDGDDLEHLFDHILELKTNTTTSSRPLIAPVAATTDDDDAFSDFDDIMNVLGKLSSA